MILVMLEIYVAPTNDIDHLTEMIGKVHSVNLIALPICNRRFAFQEQDMMFQKEFEQIRISGQLRQNHGVYPIVDML